MLLRALPSEALLWGELAAAHEKSLKPTPEQIRARAAHYTKTKEAP